MKCPKCNGEMSLIDFCENLRHYVCENCMYDEIFEELKGDDGND